MKKKLLFFLGLFAIATFFGYNYIYQDHRDIEKELAVFKLSANEIANDFSHNADLAQSKYLNETIEITGLISEQTNKSITINDKVFCQFTSRLELVQKKQQISIKGRVIGYDDLLEQVKLDQCSIIN